MSSLLQGPVLDAVSDAVSLKYFYENRALPICNLYGSDWIEYGYIDFFLMCIKDLHGFVVAHGPDVNPGRAYLLHSMGNPYKSLICTRKKINVSLFNLT